MRYATRDGETAGYIATGLRQRFEVSDGEFEVPSDLDAAAHQRLIDAGHEPLEPEALPSGVTYENAGNSSKSESGSSSGSGDGPTDGSSSNDGGEETASGGESGAMTADRIRGDEEETPEPPKPLDEMNRSELYRFGNEELNLELDWSGEEALNEEEMRERISEEL